MLIKFYFDRVNKTYFAGETVNCKVTFELKQSLALNTITVHYLGTGKTWWTEQTNHGKKEDKYECFGSMEEYFHETFICYQSFHSKTFERDTYEYETKFQLPKTLPTSFFGRHGQITYKIRAVITSHLVNTILMENEEIFYVSSVINLNSSPRLKIPILKCKSRKISLFWWKSEFITLMTKLSRKGFAIGEDIQLAIHINNQSNLDVIYIEISLNEKIMCKERRRHQNRTENYVIWKKCIGGVSKMQEKLFEISIPTNSNMMILLLDGAGIITSDYSVTVKVFTKELGEMVQTTSDVVFGTIGFKQVEDVPESDIKEIAIENANLTVK